MGNTACDEFHKWHYDTGVWTTSWWCGQEIQKSAFDLLVYQEILWECKPDIIIETGTYKGGSALFLAHMCEIMRIGHVITIDACVREQPKHERLTCLVGVTIAEQILEEVRRRCNGLRVMVILDSDHSKGYVLKELDVYAQMVSVGQYLIVEEGNINGHPVLPGWGPGPWEALAEWTPQHPEFECDKTRERFGVSWNPNGFLRRVR